MMEDVDSISVAVSGIDINTVEPLENRRMVAFINHFLCTSITFLNQFSATCERKLEKVQEKILRIDANLRILECKLASIPGTAAGTLPSVSNSSLSTSATKGASETTTTSSSTTLPCNNDNNNETVGTTSASSVSSSGSSVPPGDDTLLKEDTESVKSGKTEDGSTRDQSEERDEGREAVMDPRHDERYAKYFKMAAVGV
jgi:hypothetical protein